MATENIRNQVERTEDLLNLRIKRLKERQELSEKLVIDHTDSSKRTRNEVIGGLGVLLGILVSLLTIDPQNFLIHIMIIITIIVIMIIYFAWNKRLKTLNDVFGSDTASYDQRIIPLENILECLILMTINSYEGHFKAIREVASMVSFLNDATLLYQIKPYELLIQSKVYASDINETMKNRNEHIKSNANQYYKDYQNLKLENIPMEFRRITERVFIDNQQYIDQKISSETIQSK